MKAFLCSLTFVYALLYRRGRLKIKTNKHTHSKVNKKKCISSHVKIKSLLWDQELMNFLTALSPVETGSRGRSQTKLVCTSLMLLRW